MKKLPKVGDEIKTKIKTGRKVIKVTGKVGEVRRSYGQYECLLIDGKMESVWIRRW
jgi:hypothetical protein